MVSSKLMVDYRSIITLEPGTRDGKPYSPWSANRCRGYSGMVGFRYDKRRDYCWLSRINSRGYVSLSCLRYWQGKARRMESGCSVKLLLDENLSCRIILSLQEAFPGST